MIRHSTFYLVLLFLTTIATWLPANLVSAADTFQVTEDDDLIKIDGPDVSAAIRKRGYVTGIAAGSFVDKKTGLHDLGFGLDIVDWIMEPGSDEEYRSELPDHMVYQFKNAVHGKTPKRSIEGPQICTKAKELSPQVTRGKNYVAVQTKYKYPLAAPGRQAGSTWTQTIVFPAGERFFVSSDRIDSVNASPGMFLRLDMPGHIKHKNGDTFSEVFLSYHKELIPSSAFTSDFAPDEKFNYRRDEADEIPQRFIRAYRIRDPKTGKPGPWLAGMTLNSDDVSEAWCHQRGYVCMIEEFGGRKILPGQSFSAAYVVGFFDSIEEMEEVYDRYAGHREVVLTNDGWEMTE